MSGTTVFQDFLSRMKSGIDKRRRSRSTNHIPVNVLLSRPVIVNVYDMARVNSYMFRVGLGVFHTGVQIEDFEFSYRGHPYPWTGVVETPPKDCDQEENITFKSSLVVGHTDLPIDDIRQIVTCMGEEYRGDKYHLLKQNCNHFTQALIKVLCDGTIPPWINRLASLGSSLPFIERALPKHWLVPPSPAELSPEEIETHLRILGIVDAIEDWHPAAIRENDIEVSNHRHSWSQVSMINYIPAAGNHDELEHSNQQVPDSSLKSSATETALTSAATAS